MTYNEDREIAERVNKAVAEQRYGPVIGGLVLAWVPVSILILLLGLVGVTGLWTGALLVWAAFGAIALNNLRVARKRAAAEKARRPKLDW
jgi:hypothetical protein